MRRILSVVLILTLCFTLFACGDENNTDTTTTTQNSTTTTTQNNTTTTTMKFSTDGYYCTVADGKATITGVSDAVGEVVIPSTLNDYPVTAIGERAFSGCKSIESITIPASITSIGGSAFEGCEGLKRVNITDLSAWLEIDFAYWADDDQLRTPSFLSNPLRCGADLYLNGVKIDFSGNFVIPEGTEKIGDGSFCGFSETTSITIPASVKKIGVFAFEECENLRRVNISDLKSWIETNIGGFLLFTYDIYLNGYKFEFSGDFVIPEGTTKIGAYVFYNRDKITSVTIPNSVTTIDNSAFAGCDNLTSITIPDSVTEIHVHAFYDCDNLTICANEGSYAYQYAKDNNIKFNAL